MTGPADSGLQAERTALSWRRTGLSVAVGSLVSIRVIPPMVGSTGYVVGLVGLMWAVDLFLISRARYRAADAELRAKKLDSGGQLGPAATRTTALTVLCGCAATMLVAVSAMR